MTTLHLVDPELLPLLEILPPFNLKPHTLAAVRRAGRIAAIKAAQDAPIYDHEVRDFDVPGPDGAPPCMCACIVPTTARRCCPC